MNIQVLSDLHFDARATKPFGRSPAADVVIVAGDVCEGLPEAMRFLRGHFGDVDIVTVAGNHSFYRRRYFEEVEAGKEVATKLGIHFLENDVVELGGVRFLGATLWTDYDLYPAMRPFAMEAARKGLNDHRHITWVKNPWQRFRPAEAASLHNGSVAFLEEVLIDSDMPTVVVTHHAPHPLSIHSKHAFDRFGQPDLLNAAYASNLEDRILRWQPNLWVHGHVHSFFDYRVGETRIVCNPHGYGLENPDFNPDLVVEVMA